LIGSLRDVLWQVRADAGEAFSGIGVLISDAPDQLPIIPLRSVSALPTSGSLIATLAHISTPRSEFHDGFHVVSSAWELVRVAQYFSPPIVTDAVIDRSKLFGGRYLAALFGSALPSVQVAGIASVGFGIAVFESGKEKHFESFHD
jgi:hypothetical protein